jgi:tetratricopeptide (TPR) repeat protein
MRDGYALYFSILRWETGAEGEAGGNFIYEENISWLETMRKLGDEIPPVAALLRADLEGPPGQAELFSWALVSFLEHENGEEYQRNMIESFMVLSPGAPAAVNAGEVARRLSLWTDLERLDKNFHSYVESRRNFAEMISQGRRAYAGGNSLLAEAFFRSALNHREDHYLPHYYLGLMAYEARDYDRAEDHYRSALKYGADPAQTAYARGLNALSGGRKLEARSFLETAAAVSPARYREPAQRLGLK